METATATPTASTRAAVARCLVACLLLTAACTADDIPNVDDASASCGADSDGAGEGTHRASCDGDAAPRWRTEPPALERHVRHLQATCAKPNAEGLCPCIADADCKTAELDPCQELVCSQGTCRSRVDPQRPDCCSAFTNLTCDDGLPCTVDSCGLNMLGGWTQCQHAPTSGSCVGNGDCDDQNPCTADACWLGCCSHTLVPECCAAGQSCDDGDLCTTDSCSKAGVCVHTPVAACCKNTADCTAGGACQVGSCDAKFHVCSYAPTGVAGCCDTLADCPKPDVCQTAHCVNSGCALAQKPGCCTTASDCTGVVAPGMIGVCQKTGDSPSGTCVGKKPPGTCVDDADAVVACDDGSKCTVDYCVNNTCRHTAPKFGCCAVDADCDDGWSGTKGSCQNISAGTGTCSFKLVDGCLCTTSSACNDNNACTVDECDGCVCKHTAIKPCCQDKYDCDDDNAATLDYCIFNMCKHVPQAPGMCTPKTAATDCVGHWPLGKTGSCWKHPDGNYWCSDLPFGPKD